MLVEVEEGEEESGINEDARSQMEVDEDDGDEWRETYETPDYKGQVSRSFSPP